MDTPRWWVSVLACKKAYLSAASALARPFAVGRCSPQYSLCREGSTVEITDNMRGEQASTRNSSAYVMLVAVNAANTKTSSPGPPAEPEALTNSGSSMGGIRSPCSPSSGVHQGGSPISRSSGAIRARESGGRNLTAL